MSAPEHYPCWVAGVEDQAAEGAWQLLQREGIRVLFEKAPDLRLLPSPTVANAGMLPGAGGGGARPPAEGLGRPTQHGGYSAGHGEHPAGASDVEYPVVFHNPPALQQRDQLLRLGRKFIFRQLTTTGRLPAGTSFTLPESAQVKRILEEIRIWGGNTHTNSGSNQTVAEGFQGQNGAILAELDNRRHMRERIAIKLPLVPGQEASWGSRASLASKTGARPWR